MLFPLHLFFIILSTIQNHFTVYRSIGSRMIFYVAKFMQVTDATVIGFPGIYFSQPHNIISQNFYRIVVAKRIVLVQQSHIQADMTGANPNIRLNGRIKTYKWCHNLHTINSYLLR
jgi:hypothetical protein